jgi:hypothetical protein
VPLSCLLDIQVMFLYSETGITVEGIKENQLD